MELVLVAVALSLLLVWAGQRRMIYFPFGAVDPPAAIGLADAEAVSLTTADGLTLGGWFVAAATRINAETAETAEHAENDHNRISASSASSALDRRALTIVVFNGNAGNRSMRASFAAALRRQGISTLLFDYRGYGGNRGSPSEEGLALDARAAADYLSSRPDVDPARVVYFGESLGTGAAVRLASERRPHALILRSPFPSLVDVGRYHYPYLPVRWMLRDRFDCVERIRKIGCPLLVIAGDRDGIIPMAMSQRLFSAAAWPKRMMTIAGADHNDEALSDGPEMMAAIREFLR